MLKAVDFRKKFREKALTLLMRACDTITCEPEIAGYVIVAWDSRGRATTTISTNDGPIGNGMVADYVRSNILRRLSADDAVYNITGKDTPDDPA